MRLPCSFHFHAANTVKLLDFYSGLTSTRAVSPVLAQTAPDKACRGEFCGCVWPWPLGLSGSDTTLCLEHQQLLKGESFVELHKPKEYQLHDQECQKHLIHFFLCFVEKILHVGLNCCNSGDWYKPNHSEFVQSALMFLPLSDRDRQADSQEGKTLLKMYQNNQIFHLPNCHALCQTLLSPWSMGVLDLRWQPLQELPEVLLFPVSTKV